MLPSIPPWDHMLAPPMVSQTFCHLLDDLNAARRPAPAYGSGGLALSGESSPLTYETRGSSSGMRLEAFSINGISRAEAPDEALVR